jgi:hypothetical protein
MSAVKKGLVVGFLAAALAACDSSSAVEAAFSCEKDNRTATVTEDGKNVTLVLKEKPVKPADPSADKPKEIYSSTKTSDNANAQKRAASRYCMVGTVPSR